MYKYLCTKAQISPHRDWMNIVILHTIIVLTHASTKSNRKKRDVEDIKEKNKQTDPCYFGFFFHCSCLTAGLHCVQYKYVSIDSTYSMSLFFFTFFSNQKRHNTLFVHLNAFNADIFHMWCLCQVNLPKELIHLIICILVYRIISITMLKVRWFVWNRLNKVKRRRALFF